MTQGPELAGRQWGRAPRVTQGPELAGRQWGRAHLIAEALLEAHRDTIEQALPWDLAQLSLTVCQVGGHTVSPFVDFPGLGEGEMDIQQSTVRLASFFISTVVKLT